MAYEPTSWKAGDIVTSAKLNKMENGIAGAGPLVIGYSSYDINSGEGTLDHTWQEIHDAMISGRLVVASHSEFENILIEVVERCIVDDSDYIVRINDSSFYASSQDGYPHTPTPSPVG